VTGVAAAPPAEHSILWRRLDQPGHEAARLSRQPDGWHLTGAAVFAYDAEPCRLDYRVVCDAAWHTTSARVTGWVGRQTVEIDLSVGAGGRWWVGGVECPGVVGCVDLDLSFSPATNLLPIRRLGLAVGEEAEVRAAWLRIPGLTLEPLDQRYRRLDVTTYRYESDGGRFAADLRVGAAGFVVRYPGLWDAAAGG
jgi:hypothetical protein